MERAGLMLLLFALLQRNSCREFKLYRDPEELFYRQYVGWAEGVPLREAAGRYQEEQKRFDEIGRRAEQAAKDYAVGEISYEEAEAAKMELQAVQNARLGFEKALTQYEYVLGKVREGTDAEPFYASGWEALFDRRGQWVDVMDTEKLDFFLIVGLASVFSVGKSSQVELMQRTCARGRGGVCRKNTGRDFFTEPSPG